MKKTTFFVSILGAMALLLGACGPTSSGPGAATEDINAMYTQAVQTIMVQLTADALNAQATQAASGAQPTQPVVLPADTSTPQLATATFEPTTTQTPTETPTPTVTQVLPTPTFSTEDIVKSLGGPTWRDEFEDERYWRFSQYYKDPKKILMEAVNGKAVLTAFDADYYYEWLLTWPNPEDFYLEITATTGSTCEGLDKYGLIFRAPDPTEGYLVAFTCDGRYSLWYYDGEKEVDILDWKTSDKIKAGPDQTNRLGIKAQGSQLTIYANGVAIDTLTDTKQSKGQFGLMVGSVNTENFTVMVEKLEFWDFTK